MRLDEIIIRRNPTNVSTFILHAEVQGFKFTGEFADMGGFLTAVSEETGYDLDPTSPDLEGSIAKLGGIARIVGATLRDTANPTMLKAGYKANVIPATAIAVGDTRTLSPEQEARVRAKMAEIVARHLPGTDAKLEFSDESYPPMAPTEGNRAVLARLNVVNRDLGLPEMAEGDPAKRGAGDISFVAADVDGLVGLGTAGDGSHAPGETIDLKSVDTQAKRTAILMTRLSKERRGK